MKLTEKERLAKKAGFQLAIDVIEKGMLVANSVTEQNNNLNPYDNGYAHALKNTVDQLKLFVVRCG